MKVSIIITITGALLYFHLANAQDAEPVLEEITVTAKRVEGAIADAPAAITVISEDALQAQLSVNADVRNALSKLVPGIEVPLNGGQSLGTYGPALRGRSANVLINGALVNQLVRGGGFDVNMVDPAAVERLEVKRGSTAVFGFGAPGGVIYLKTREGRTAQPEWNLRAYTSADFNEVVDSLYSRVYVGVGAKPDDFDYYVGVGYGTDGQRFSPQGDAIFGDKAHYFNIDTTLGWDISDEVRLTSSLVLFRRNVDKAFVVPGYTFGNCDLEPGDCSTIEGNLDPNIAIAEPTIEARENFQENYLWTGNYQHQDLFWGNNLDVTLFLQKNRFSFAGLNASFVSSIEPNLFENTSDDRKIALRSNFSKNISFGTQDLLFSYGADFMRNEYIRPVRIGVESVPLLYAVGSISTYLGNSITDLPLSPPITVESAAAFTQLEHQWRQWIFSGGLRYEELSPKSTGYVVPNYVVDNLGNTQDLIFQEGKIDDISATLFNLGAVYQPTESLDLFAAVTQGVEVTEIGTAMNQLARSVAASTLTEVDPSDVNPKPAKTTQYEIGSRWRGTAVTGSAAVFFTESKLSSRLDCSDPQVPCQSVRRPERLWGFEADAKWAVAETLTLGTLLSFQEGEVREDDGTQQRLENGQIFPPRVVLFSEWQVNSPFALKSELTHSFARDPFADVELAPFGILTGNVEAYTLFDITAEIACFGGKLSLAVANVFNREYRDPFTQSFRDSLFYIPEEGRRFGITFQRSFE
jgi:iron complex outermembrane recepter protein